MKVWRASPFASFVVVGTLVGYPAAAGFALLSGFQNTNTSILLRAGILACTLIVICLKRGRLPKQTLWVWLILLLMTLYGLRIAVETAFYADTLGKEPAFYWIWYLGVSVGPCLSMMFLRELDHAQIERWMIICLVFSAIVVVSLGTSSKTSDSGDVSETGRFALEALNPISLGYVGAQLALLGIWRAFATKNMSSHKRLFGFVLAALGLYVLFLSSSRGPVLATLAVFLFMFMSQRGLKQIWLIFAVTIFVAAGTSYLLSIAATYNVSFLSRMTDFGTSDASSAIRLSLYVEALDIVYNNPYFGRAFEVPSYRSYPHNFFLEFYMATGIIAGTAAVVVMLGLAVKSLKMVMRFHPGSVMAQLYVMNLIGAQFSGAVFSNSALWMCAMIVAVVPMASLRRQRPEQEASVPIIRQSDLQPSLVQTAIKR